MGQKTNANIFRLGFKENNWKTKYIENSHEDFSLYSFQDNEIKKYLKQLLKLNGLILHNYKLQYSETTLHLFISYYTTFKSFSYINQLNSNQKIPSIIKNNKKSYNTQKKKPKKRLKLIKKYKEIINAKNFITLKSFKTENFVKKITECLTFFTKKNFNIFITFQNLNKGLSLQLNLNESKALKTVLLKFRKDFRQNFFKETTNILLICVNKKNSARLLSEYISYQLNRLTKLKKHRFFLGSLKRLLIELSRTNLYKIKGIKIVINGRFNGIPRARKHILLIGNVPLQSFDSKIDYYQSNSYTTNGTFGVKTWICEG